MTILLKHQRKSALDSFLYIDMTLGLNPIQKQIDLFFNNSEMIESILFSLNSIYKDKIKENRLEMVGLEKNCQRCIKI